MRDVALVLRALLLGLCLIILMPTSVAMSSTSFAIAQAEVRDYLTPEILASKTHELVQQNGKETIDLSNLIIDLANVESEFNQYFYQ